MKTYTPKPADIQREWYVVDAKDQTLGRLATQIAVLLRGKHKPIFSPHMDVGDFVIVINADKIRVSGNKMETKMYYRHSGHPGGLTSITLRDQLQRFPDRVIRSAVRGMLPKNSLGRKQLKKLKIYAAPTHPHEAQRPKTYEL
ncbi:MAG: 50S ribosomal protein L13 [Chloroflexi bacterium]|nr:50S ribosomal protein L13 [Chloroflexota bacterium]